MQIFFNIITISILPIFILITLGYVMDKRFNLDTNTLTKIHLYLFLPAFAFVNIYVTDVTFDLVRVIALVSVLLMINFFFSAGLGRLLRFPYKTRKAFENSVMFYNCGNIGVPLMILMFSSSLFAADGSTRYLEIALSVQVMTLLVQNLATNTFGIINSGGEGMNAKKGIMKVFNMPAIYGIALAFLLKPVPFDITTTSIWQALLFLQQGLIPVALIVLGAQLSKTKIDLKSKTPYIPVVCRLIGGPVIAFMLIRLFGFEGVMAQAIFVASSTPTAVTCALITIEAKGDSTFAVQTVTISTLLSVVTMTAVVYLAYVLF